MIERAQLPESREQLALLAGLLSAEAEPSGTNETHTKLMTTAGFRMLCCVSRLAQQERPLDDSSLVSRFPFVAATNGCKRVCIRLFTIGLTGVYDRVLFLGTPNKYISRTAVRLDLYRHLFCSAVCYCCI